MFCLICRSEELTLPRCYSYVVLNVHVNSKSSNLYVFDKAFTVDNAFFLSSPFHFIKSIFHANCFRVSLFHCLLTDMQYSNSI